MSAPGITMIELVTIVALAIVVGGIGVVRVSQAVADVRARGAARTFALLVRDLRAQAVQRSASVGLQFEAADGTTRIRAYMDGNGNGLRSAEIATGVDPPIGLASTLAELGGGLSFGRDPTAPPVGEDAPGEQAGPDEGATGDADGTQVGSLERLTFGASGTGTSGTVYLREVDRSGGTGGGRQFAVRVYGPTGRIRLLELERSSSRWVER